MAYTNEDIVKAALRGLNANNGRGTMSTDSYRAGFTRYGAPYTGQLPPRLAAILDARFRAGTIRQVIYSYATPIAWRDGDMWVIPEVTYSVTTSTKHQTHLYRIRGEYVPRDAGLDEYLQILSGATRYAFHDGARKRSYRGAK